MKDEGRQKGRLYKKVMQQNSLSSNSAIQPDSSNGFLTIPQKRTAVKRVLSTHSLTRNVP